MRPTAIDLFAGIGGLSLGLEQAGFDVVAAVEADPTAALMHKLNFMHCKVFCKDICDVTADELSQAAGDRPLGLLAGGPPCQGFSSMGKRYVDDLRNQLVFQFARLVKELKPRMFLIENVRGMHEGESKQILDELICRLQRIGYHVLLPYRILCTSHYGIPQERRRLFLIGSMDRLPVWPKPTCAPRKLDGSEIEQEWPPIGPSVKDAIWDLLPIDDAGPEDVYLGELRIPRSRYASYLRGGVRDPDDYSYARILKCPGLSGNSKTEHSQQSMDRFAAARQGAIEPVTHFFKLAPEGLCNTLRAGTGADRGGHTAPRPIHPTVPRCITVREAARLHSYPDWFRFHGTRWHGHRHIGNSVPPIMARELGKSIIEALGYKREKPSGMMEMGPEEWANRTPLTCQNYFRHAAKKPKVRKSDRRMHSDELKEKIYQALLEGKRTCDVADEFDVCKAVVSRVWNSWAVKRNPIEEDPFYEPLKKPPKPPPNCAIGAKGEDHYSSKLTNVQRNEILEALSKSNERGILAALARKYGVASVTIYNYKRLLLAGKTAYEVKGARDNQESAVEDGAGCDGASTGASSDDAQDED